MVVVIKEYGRLFRVFCIRARKFKLNNAQTSKLYVPLFMVWYGMVIVSWLLEEQVNVVLVIYGYV